MEAIRAQLDEDVKIEIWFQNEARIGQKNKITRRWAKRGTRPSAPHDLRTKWVYIFGAICRAKGEAIGLVLPYRQIYRHAYRVGPASFGEGGVEY